MARFDVDVPEQNDCSCGYLYGGTFDIDRRQSNRGDWLGLKPKDCTCQQKGQPDIGE